MLRATVTYLLIAIVLACPNLCVGESAAASSAQSAACRCICADCDNPSTGESPTTKQHGAPEDDSDDGTPDCLCRGAVLDGSRVGDREPSTDLTATPIFELVSDEPCRNRLSNADLPLSRHFPRSRSGRGICALTCSLLL